MSASALSPNLSKPTCRACLQNKQDEELNSIFNVDADFCDLRIYESIEQLAGIEVLLDDKLPTLICVNCYELLKVSYKFRTVCRNSNEYLKEFITKELVSQKNETFVEQYTVSIAGENSNQIEDSPDSMPHTVKMEESASGPMTPDEFLSDFDDKFDTEAYENFDLSIIQSLEKEPLNVPSDEDSISHEEKQTQRDENKNNYECEACGNIYLHRRSLIFHMKKEKHAGSILNFVRYRRKHNQIDENAKKHVCEICGKIYLHQNSLRFHMARHSLNIDGTISKRLNKHYTQMDENEKKYVCQVCGKRYLRRTTLKYHMKKHEDGSNFNSRRKPQRHYTQVDENEKKHACEVCGKKYVHQKSLILHMEKHRWNQDGTIFVQKHYTQIDENEKKYKCEVCGKKYLREITLKYHMKRHEEQKSFNCENCGSSFISAYLLKLHLRIHTTHTDLPHKCSYCPRRFGIKSRLRYHERIHKNEKPFPCEICGRKFSYSGVLNSHKLTHTGEKPYKCEICSRPFLRSSQLRWHLQTTKHKNDPRVPILLSNIRKTQ